MLATPAVYNMRSVLAVRLGCVQIEYQSNHIVSLVCFSLSKLQCLYNFYKPCYLAEYIYNH